MIYQLCDTKTTKPQKSVQEFLDENEFSSLEDAKEWTRRRIKSISDSDKMDE
ncbi:hypothetical protein JXA85_00105 [Candidatus Woesearchaeota archaeon]|nr:hypothetical protein [Candidatus Woesearchaeota archaeon]